MSILVLVQSPSPLATTFVGGMNVPSRVGRVNASRPLAELTITNGALVLRPRWFAAWILRDFVIPLDQVTDAFPLSGRLISKGIGVSMAAGQVAYFWTARPDEVLAALDRAGVPVDPLPRGASEIWKLRRAPEGMAADNLRMPRWLVAAWPVLAFMSLGLLLVVMTRPELGWFRWVVALFWLVGIGTGGLTWLRARRLQ